MNLLRDFKLAAVFFLTLASAGTGFSQSSSAQLDSAYMMLKHKRTKEAIALFENHIRENPKDTRIYLQLAYLYDSQGDKYKSLRYFEYVRDNSTNRKEVDQATASVSVLQQMIPDIAKHSIELNAVSYYDSYQNNYITGFLGYYRFRVSNRFYAGTYLDVYTDSRSSKELIYNDRYFELGLYTRFYMLRTLSFELRLGFVREIDLERSTINVSPRLMWGTRLGNSVDYIGKNPTKRNSIFMDIYALVSYDYKFKNGFGQLGMQQVWRNNITGFSILDFYLSEYGVADNRRLWYNNYVEVGPGIRYKPDLPYFPYIFAEYTYKYYFEPGGKRSTTQAKGGVTFFFKLKV